MLFTGNSKGTVLVIEDCPEVQRYLRVMLELDHYHVEVAGNGEDGVRRVRDGYTPQVVLLDMQMPGMNGLQTLQELRALSPDVKVIMCSAEDDPEVIREAIVLGAKAYLIKPIQHLYLTAAVERCLTHSPGSRPREVRVLTMPAANACRTN
ncbi:MAG TPA: response regulator [Terriglobales bacterium]|jgi:two-component system response regulator (stage 0 sporulation protein F)|nr:response regulator [Terriglobales bacterium]